MRWNADEKGLALEKCTIHENGQKNESTGENTCSMATFVN